MLAAIQWVQGWAWNLDGETWLTMAGHLTSHWGRGSTVLQWVERRSVVKAWTGDLGWASMGWRCQFLHRVFEDCLSWPSCLSPCSSHTSLFPLPGQSLHSLSLCLQKCLSWVPAAW